MNNTSHDHFGRSGCRAIVETEAKFAIFHAAIGDGPFAFKRQKTDRSIELLALRGLHRPMNRQAIDPATLAARRKQCQQEANSANTARWWLMAVSDKRPFGKRTELAVETEPKPLYN